MTRRRQVGTQLRPVGGNQHVRLEKRLALRKQLIEARRADFLAHFQDELAIETQGAALGENGAQRSDVDAMLALIVGGAAPINPVAFHHETEWVQAFAPLLGLGTNDIAVTVDQHGFEGGVLDALGEEEGDIRIRRIFQNPAFETEARQLRRDFLIEIAQQRAAIRRLLAFGLESDHAAELLQKAALQIALNSLQGGCAGWHVR